MEARKGRKAGKGRLEPTRVSDVVQNHFLQAERAAEYDRYRPYFHPLVFSRVTLLTSTTRFARALDIGCGTGQSTRAMAAVSTQVVGLDASAAMLQQARSRGVPCIRASAERLPLADGAFDLVGVGLAFHWFDRPAVVREARRVLTERGWLVIFNSWFAGTMHGNSDFARWHQDYLRRFPSPPRHAEPLTDHTIHAADFRQVASEAFAHQQVFTREALVGYLKTCSIELIQYVSSGWGGYRAADVNDIVLNVGGAGIGLAVATLAHTCRKRVAPCRS